MSSSGGWLPGIERCWAPIALLIAYAPYNSDGLGRRVVTLPTVTAIITGVSGGLGRHFCARLLEAGACVVGCDLRDEELKDLQRNFSVHDGRFVAFPCDVSQELDVQAFIKSAFGHFGDCNVLVNNAGILRDGVLVKTEDGFVRSLPLIQWQQVLNVNLTGAFLVSREFSSVLAALPSRPDALIVNISSISSAGNPGQSNYSASKAGLDACTRTWALELAALNIRVAGIAPGLIETPMLRRVSEQRRRELVSSIPLGRTGNVEDVWQALRFLIECDFFTGRTVEVDGGANF